MNGGLRLCRNSHKRKLVDFRLAETHTSAVEEAVFDRPKPNRNTLHQLGFDCLPSHVHHVFEWARLGDDWQRSLERDAVSRGLVEFHSPHGLVMLVLPQQRQFSGELCAQRLHNVANPVGGRRRGDAGDFALVIVKRLDFQQAICPVAHLHWVLQCENPREAG